MKATITHRMRRMIRDRTLHLLAQLRVLKNMFAYSQI